MTDLKVNYSILDDILGAFKVYQVALTDMETAIDSATRTVLQSKGQGIHAIQTLSDDTKRGLGKYQDQLSDLISIIDGFVVDMMDCVMPEYRNVQMRVNSDNIKWSVGKIDENINKDINKLRNAINRTPWNVRVTEVTAMGYQRNHNKLSGLLSDISTFESGMSVLTGDLWDMYNSHVKPYQEYDEEFARRIKELYENYSSWWEKFCDFWKDVGSTIADFFVGLFEALWSLISGIYKLVVGLLKLVAGGLIWCVTAPFGMDPLWVKEMFANIGTVASAIFNDPSLVWEGLSHSISEAWDNKGAAYCIGYGVGLILPIIITWGIGALGEGAGDATIVAGLLEEGITVDELVLLGVDAATLIKAGVGTSEVLSLLSAGLIEAGELLSVVTLQELLLTLSFRELMLVITLDDLLISITLQELLVTVTLPELLLSVTFQDLLLTVTVYELISVISVEGLIGAGVGIVELFNAGVLVADLVQAGATIDELIKAGIQIDELLNAGVKVEEISSYLENLAKTNPSKVADILKGTGRLDESLKAFTKLNYDEQRIVIKLITENGKQVTLMPETPNVGKAFDFLVDGLPVELKTLNGNNINTLVGRVGDALEQLGESGYVIYDISKAGFTPEQMEEIVSRLIGRYGEDIVERIIFMQ